MVLLGYGILIILQALVATLTMRLLWSSEYYDFKSNFFPFLVILLCSSIISALPLGLLGVFINIIAYFALMNRFFGFGLMGSIVFSMYMQAIQLLMLAFVLPLF